MRRPITLLAASLMAFVAASPSSAQGITKPLLPVKLTKSLKGQSKASDEVLAKVKRDHPLLFQRKSLGLSSGNQFSDARRMIKVRKGDKVANSLLTSGGEQLPLWMNIVTESSAGIYSLTPSATMTPTELVSYNKGYFNGGVGLYDGKLGGVYLDTSFASWGIILDYFYSFDTDTWELADQPKSLGNNYSLIAVETAHDPATDQTFGEFYNADASAVEFGVIDYNTLTRTTVGTATHTYAAMGIAKDGFAYGVASDGNLYKIDRTTGSETLVGATGIQVANYQGSYYYQSGEIDPKSDVFYWAARDSAGVSGLYTVNLTSGAATKVGDYSSDYAEGMYVGMVIPAPAAEDGAPATVTDSALNFEGGALAGNVTFKAPARTFDGSTTLSGSLNYQVILNGTDTVKGTTTPGAVTTVPVTAQEGVNHFVVRVGNSVGFGPSSRLTGYVGYDTPLPPDMVKFDVDDTGKATVTWQGPSAGVHGGYLGDLTYNVYRISGTDTTKVAEALTQTTFTETFPTSALKQYCYGVVASNGHYSSAARVSDGKLVGGAIEVPFLEEFTTNLGLFTVIDANNDGSTWQWEKSDKCAAYRWSTKNQGDDWLISPPIHLQAGKAYEVTFKARSISKGSLPERLAASWGRGNTVADMTNVLQSDTMLNSKTWRTFSKRITADEDGSYYFGFHAISDPDRYFLQLDSVSIVLAPQATAPDTVTALKATADANGNLRATISFNAPTKAIDGSSLSSLDSISVSKGTKLIGKVKNPVPGSAYSVADINASQGNNTYTVVAYNKSGIGLKSSVTVYVGVDAPGVPKVSALDKTTSVHLSWNAVSGANGGFIKPGEVRYDIFNVDDEGYLSDSVSSVTGTTAYDVTGLNTNEGDVQNYRSWAVRAANAAGNSGFGSASVVVGKPYLLPFHDSFKNQTLEDKFFGIHRTTSEYSWGVTSDDAYDGDGGAVSFKSSTAADGYMQTGKISFAGAVNPKLLFYYKVDGSTPATLKIVVEHKDGSVDAPVYTKDLSTNTETGWQRALVDLPASLADEDYAIIRIQATATDDMQGTYVYIDNLNIIDPEQRDAAVELTAPATVTKGQTAHLVAKVSNEGLDALNNARLVIKVNGKQVADTTINKQLATLETATVPVDYRTTTLDQSTSLNVTAQVTAAGDLVADNNSASATIEAVAADVAAPTDLKANGLAPTKLSWSAPTSSSTSVTDDFEGYTPWSTSFGDWTTYDDGGYAGGLTQQGSYEHQGEQFAFIDWQPSDIFETGQGLDPHSGTKALVAIYQLDADGQNFVDADNWLVTPRLSGKAQHISFWVNNLQGDGFGSETFQVLTSTTDNSKASFTQLGSDYTQSSGTWTQIGVDVPEGTKYLAVRHTTGGNQQFIFMIDDFTYEVSSGPVAYNVYRDGEFVAQVESTQYTDLTTTADGEYTFKVTAVYADGSESAPIETLISTSISNLEASGVKSFDVYTLDGVRIMKNASSLKGVRPGVYIINGVKTILRK